ncbi:MAG: hypothetical protein H5U40_07085 [Polyangiaceae bacterium]|nr:hypothetical protein [Polyangiaceae bacterium]
MRFSVHDLPQELASLPEPARMKALQALNDLLDKGAERDDAVRQVRAQAENWATERSEASLIDKER